jgi:hypothetical protein
MKMATKTHTKLTKQELNTVREAAESVASRYDFIHGIDFLIEVKNIVGSGKNHIGTALAVWKSHYE